VPRSWSYAGDTWKLPISGVKVYVVGDEQDAVYTNAAGHFMLTNVPAGSARTTTTPSQAAWGRSRNSKPWPAIRRCA
jgi:hypothetical protein